MLFITIIVPDTKMISHSMYYTYHQYQEKLFLLLCDDYTKPPLNNLFLTNPCNEFLGVRIEELRQSKKISKEVSMHDAPNRLYGLYSLHEFGEFSELCSDRSWNTLDAVGFNNIRQMLHRAQIWRERIVREAAEQTHRKENMAEESRTCLSRTPSRIWR